MVLFDLPELVRNRVLVRCMRSSCDIDTCFSKGVNKAQADLGTCRVRGSYPGSPCRTPSFFKVKPEVRRETTKRDVGGTHIFNVLEEAVTFFCVLLILLCRLCPLLRCCQEHICPTTRRRCCSSSCRGSTGWLMIQEASELG